MSFLPALYDELLEAEVDQMALEQLRLEFDGRMARVENQLAEQGERLTKLILAVEGYRGNQEQTLMILQRIVNRHDEQLNGYQDKPGIAMKVDRLERTEGVRVWNLRALWVATLGGLMKLLVDGFRR